MADGIVGKISVGDGATFTPHVDADGILTFTNNKNLPNPDPFDIPAKVLELGPSVLGLAPLASPAFTGNPTAPTPSASDNSTKLANTEFVDNVLKSYGYVINYSKRETISSGADLDDYLTLGSYRITSGSVASNIANTPVHGANAFLLVQNPGSSTYRQQIYFEGANNPRVFMRSYNGDSKVWHPWVEFAFTDSNITGNAATATKAMQDGDGNVITDSYTKKLTLSVPANKNGKIRVGCDTATSMFFSAIVSINCAEGRTWNRMYAISGYGSGTSSRTKSYMFPTDDNDGAYTVSINGGFIEFAFSSSARRQIVYANVSVLAENPSYPMSISFIEEST